MPRSKSTHATRNAARRSYEEHRQNVRALCHLVDQHAEHISVLLSDPCCDDSSLTSAVIEFREVRRVIDRTLADEIPQALETRCNQMHNPLIMELFRCAGGNVEMQATALGLPVDYLAPSKRKVATVPQRRISPAPEREPAYPHVDSYPCGCGGSTPASAALSTCESRDRMATPPWRPE